MPSVEGSRSPSSFPRSQSSPYLQLLRTPSSPRSPRSPSSSTFLSSPTQRPTLGKTRSSEHIKALNHDSYSNGNSNNNNNNAYTKEQKQPYPFEANKLYSPPNKLTRAHSLPSPISISLDPPPSPPVSKSSPSSPSVLHRSPSSQDLSSLLDNSELLSPPTYAHFLFNFFN